MPEEAIILLIGILVASIPLAALVMSIVALVRSNRVADLTRRIADLEAAIRPSTVPALARPKEPIAEEPVAQAEIVPEPEPATAPWELPAPIGAQKPIDWELLIGRKALGWVAVVVFLFAAAFFIRYAFENQWIGPLGRVSLGAVVGTALVIGGWNRHRRGWRIFSQMLTAAGLVVLYLSTYAAFGFYQLLPQQAAAVFLVVLVLESAVLAVAYNAPAIGLASLAGGLLIPILMHTDHDRYQSLFTYLTVLDAGVLLMLVFRAWRGIGSLALLGTHGLFWLWYGDNYHPEKLGWALGFHIVLLAMFLGQTVLMHVLRGRRAGWEDLLRMLLNASLGFAAWYVLLNADYHAWLGSTAVAMAVIYTAVARCILAWRPRETRQLLTAMAIAVSFVAMAFAIEGEAAWVALGWMAEATLLWWFGNRVQAPVLRAMAGVLAGMAVLRVFADTPWTTRDPFLPIFNTYALPALTAAALLIGGVAATRRFLPRLGVEERFAAGAAWLGGIVLVCFILSVETFGYFDALAMAHPADAAHWRWFGQMSLSILWAVLATILLAVGFRARLAQLRWLAMALYACTVTKVFLFDMAELNELFRILAFFVLAVFLAIAAWAYQRIRIELESNDSGEGSSHDQAS